MKRRICQCCGALLTDVYERGPFRVESNPPRAFYAGREMKLGFSQAFLLFKALVRFGAASYEVLGFDCAKSGWNASTWLRRELRRVSGGRATLKSMHGWGYELQLLPD